MGQSEKKEGEVTFLLFIPKLSKIKNSKEIEKQKTKNPKDIIVNNASILNKNKPILKLNQMFNTNNDLSNTDSMVELEAELEVSLEAEFNLDDGDQADLISGVLATETDKTRISKKK